MKLYSYAGKPIALPPSIPRPDDEADPIDRLGTYTGVFGVATLPWAHCEFDGEFLTPQTHDLLWVSHEQPDGPRWTRPELCPIPKGWRERSEELRRKEEAKAAKASAVAEQMARQDAEIAEAKAEARAMLANAGVSEWVETQVDEADYAHAKAWGYETKPAMRKVRVSRVEALVQFGQMVPNWREVITNIISHHRNQ